MKLKIGIVALYGIIFCFAGCKPSSTDALLSGNSQFSTKRSALDQEALKEALPVGTSRQNVIKILGAPDSEIVLDETHYRLDYIYESPVFSRNRENSIGGATIFFEKDALIRWSPILGPLEKTIQADSLTGNLTERKETPWISFTEVSETPMDNGRFVDTPIFPKLGYVKSNPSLIISNLISLKTSVEIVKDQPNYTNYILTVECPRADAEKFSKFYQDNLGRLVLVAFEDKEIASYRLKSVITSQRLNLPVVNETRFIELQRRLR